MRSGEKKSRARKVKRTIRRVTDEKRPPDAPRLPTVIAEEGDAVICRLTLPSESQPLYSDSDSEHLGGNFLTDELTEESVSFEVPGGSADDNTRLLLQMKRNIKVGSSSSSSSSSRAPSPASSSSDGAAPIQPLRRFNDANEIRLMRLSSSDDEDEKKKIRKLPALVAVDVIEGRDIVGAANPCCVVKVREQKRARVNQKTKIVRNSRSPIWDFSCSGKVASVDRAVVVVVLLDGNEKCAKLKRSLAGTDLGTVIEDWFDLTGLDGRPAGEVRMRVRVGATRKEDDTAGILKPEIVIKNGKRKHRYRHHKRRTHEAKI